MNYFLKNLKFAQGPSARSRRRNQSRFDGGGRKPATTLQSVQSVMQQAGPSNVLNTGRRSFHNTETPLHNNAIVLKLTNNSATDQADLVLTAGRFATASRYSPQVIGDGTANYTNDAATAVSVEVVSEYGVDGTNNAWATIQDYIEKDGLLIVATRLEYLTNAQKMHKLRFKREELFGDHVVDHIFPAVYYNPDQYNDKVVQSDVAYVLDSKTVVKYSLQPSEEVMITLWVGAQLELERTLADAARLQGGNSLM